MARPIRIEYPGAVYHIIARGIEGSRVIAGDDEKSLFVEVLSKSKRSHSLILYGYSIMDNHYHLQIETPQGNLVEGMTGIQRDYAIRLNARSRRRGHVFEGRYKAILVDREGYLLEASRYLHLNAVRAGIVRRPEDYRWSSYRDYIGLRREGVTDVEWVLGRFSRKRAEAMARYAQFVNEKLGIARYDPFAEVYGGYVLGSREFVRRIKESMRAEPRDQEIGERRYLKPRLSIETVLREVCRFYNEQIEEVVKPRARGKQSDKVALYLLRKHAAVPTGILGEYFGGRTRSSVSKTVQRLAQSIEREEKLRREIQDLEQIMNL